MDIKRPFNHLCINFDDIFFSTIKVKKSIIIIVENNSNIYLHLTHYTLNSKHPCSSSTCPVQTFIYIRLSIYLSIYLFYVMFKDISSQLGPLPLGYIGAKTSRKKMFERGAQFNCWTNRDRYIIFKKELCTQKNSNRNKTLFKIYVFFHFF